MLWKAPYYMRKSSLTILIMLFSLCTFDENQYDPLSSSYTPPTFVIDSLHTSIFNGDTVTDDSGIITVVANKSVNQIRWKLDSTSWSSWVHAGVDPFEIRVVVFDTGHHKVNIQTCYSNDGEIGDTVISFFRKQKFCITGMVDSAINIIEGECCTLWVKAQGTFPFHYTWYFDTTAIDSFDTDSFFIQKASLKQSGSYYCRLKDCCGEITSGKINLQVYEKFKLSSMFVPDSFRIGKKDTLTFISSLDRKDTLSCHILNKNDYSSKEITVLTQKPDSLIFILSPDSAGERELFILMTNGHMSDTLRFQVQVPEEIPVWIRSDTSISAIEGTPDTIDLRPLMSYSLTDPVSLSAEFGKIVDTMWIWTPKWGCESADTCIISAVCGYCTYKLHLNIAVNSGDSVGPKIKLVDSSLVNDTISSSQISIKAFIADSLSGVESVLFVKDTVNSKGILGENGTYSGAITKLQSGKRTRIQIRAEDKSMRHNSSVVTFYLTYDSKLKDAVPPIIIQTDGPINGSRVTNANDSLRFSITDDSKLDSVYWTLNGSFGGQLVSNGNGDYKLVYTLNNYGKKQIVIHAIDSSENKNHDSISLTLNYNTPIKGINLDNPRDDAKDIDTMVTFAWRGGDDPDGDTVYYSVNYGSSKDALNRHIECFDCNSIKLPDDKHLTPYTTYYWLVTAYSKTYPDTVLSSINSFRTCARLPRITSQPVAQQDVELGRRAVFTVKATGYPKPSYIWKKNGTKIKNATFDSLVIDSVVLADSGQYTVEVFNSGATVVSSASKLGVIYPIKIAAGGSHSLILKSNGTLWACGLNDYGQLCDGTTVNRSNPIKVMDSVQDIAAGFSHSFFIKRDSSLWACGQNKYDGHLGNGSTADIYQPMKIMDRVKAIATGPYHSLFLKYDGSLWGCGKNSHGQLGNGSTVSVATPVHILDSVQAITVGDYHSLMLKTDGSLWGCGRNSDGQLGNSNLHDDSIPKLIASNVIDIAAGSYHSLFLNKDYSLLACGYNSSGQIGNGKTSNVSAPFQVMNGVKKGVAGYNHTLIIKNDGTLWACGSDSSGALGYGSTSNQLTPVRVFTNVQNVTTGGSHSLIIGKDGSLWVCGSNNSGQLGDGTNANRTTPVRIIPVANRD